MSTDSRRTTIAIFVLGTILHGFLMIRSWIGGDQIHLLNLGMDFAVYGIIRPFAKLMSGAGGNPGSLLQLLVGIPLKVVPHYQSPMIVILLFHVGAGWLLVSLFRMEFGDRTASFFLIIYWLSPWRLYNSGFLWEPSFVFLPAALHLWSCWRLREKKGFAPSIVLGTALMTSVQIHNSAFLLFLLTVVLIVRKLIRIHWTGLMLGSALGSLTLIPAITAVAAGAIPEVKESQGFLGESFLKIYPVFKGVLYWFTLSGLDVVRPLNETVFIHSGVLNVWVRFLQTLCVASVGISLISSWWFFRPIWREPEEVDSRMSWWRSYAGWTFVCLVISAALSPIVLQGWQVVVVLHAATIPMILWVSQKWYRGSAWQKRAVGGYVVLQTLLVMTIGLGHPIFSVPDSLPAQLKNELNQNLMNIIPVK